MPANDRGRHYLRLLHGSRPSRCVRVRSL